MTETTIAKFHGHGKFWLAPVGASVLVVIISAIVGSIAGNESGALIVGCGGLIIVWCYLGSLYRSGKDYIEVTNHRLVGRTGHGLVSGEPSQHFSIPYSEIEDVSDDMLRTRISIKGRKRPVEFVHPENQVEFRGFLKHLIDIRNTGSDYPEDAVDYGVRYKHEPQLYRFLYDLALRSQGKRAQDVPDGQHLNLSPMPAVIEGPGGSGGTPRATVALLAGVVIIVVGGASAAAVMAVADVQSRLGGANACVTLARLYRDQSDEAVLILIERVDKDPARSAGRFVVSKFIGSAISEAFQDNAFEGTPGIQCSLKIARDYYGQRVIATDIADRMEAELIEMLG